MFEKWTNIHNPLLFKLNQNVITIVINLMQKKEKKKQCNPQHIN